jgi:cobalt-zinc-cadmium efflux system outer membrane protein
VTGFERRTFMPRRQYAYRGSPTAAIAAMRTSGVAVVMLVCAVAALSARQSSPPVPPLTLAAAIDRAMAVNPALAAARVQRSVALAGVGVAGERPNPELRVELEKETPKEAYGLTVPVELGGKRGRRLAVEQARVRTTDAQIAVSAADVRDAVRRAYFARLGAEARLDELQAVHALGVRVRDAARQRFESGSAPRLEVLQAELALSQADNEVEAAQGAVLGARYQLNALLALPLDAATPLAGSLEPGDLPAPDAAVRRAQAASAELALIDHQIEEQQFRVALARALQVPDVTPEATLTRGAEPEFSTGWRAAVAIAVPIFTTHSAGVRVEQTTLDQLGAERRATAARIAGAVAAAAAQAGADRQQYLRFSTQILPQAVEVERMAEDSYRLGQTGIAAFLQALQATRDARLRALQAAEDYQAALADLERAMGVPLP